MAVIHRGRFDPRKRMRRARTLTALCWPTAALSLGLTVCLYVTGSDRLLALAEAWRESFLAWAMSPGAEAATAADWLQSLWRVAAYVIRGAAWAIFGLTMGLPGLLGVGLTVLCACLLRPALREYRSVRARVKAVSEALRLLAPMPASCHIFRNKRIISEGVIAQPELILVGPGGVAVMEVRSVPGMIEGCVTDAVLRRRCPDGDVEKMRNPARPAVACATRLSNLLASLGLKVHVLPCVVFVHPDASVYVTPPDVLQTGGRRTRISTCLMTDATSFWEEMGRAYANGRVLRQETVDAIVTAIRKAPEGRRRD